VQQKHASDVVVFWEASTELCSEKPSHFTTERKQLNYYFKAVFLLAVEQILHLIKAVSVFR